MQLSLASPSGRSFNQQCICAGLRASQSGVKVHHYPVLLPLTRVLLEELRFTAPSRVQIEVDNPRLVAICQWIQFLTWYT